jgi:hypothetical protein
VEIIWFLDCSIDANLEIRYLASLKFILNGKKNSPRSRLKKFPKINKNDLSKFNKLLGD